MSQFEKLPNPQYDGVDPFNGENEIQISEDLVRFFLQREKKARKYLTQYDVQWKEIVSFDICEVHYCKDNLTWPIDETPHDELKPIDTAGLVFFYTLPHGRAYFPIWSIIPMEDVPEVRKLVEEQLGRPMLPGLAHHGTAAAVKYMVEHCEVLDTIQSEWHDYTKRGRQAKPNPKFRERGPDYVYCKEGLALSLYGAGEQLEQMSAFWPWRFINRIVPIHDEFQIRYLWADEAYSFTQQVLDEDERKRFADAAERAMNLYHSSDDVDELLMIRPWSFPSRFHRTWDKLEPLSSKASRNQFPPIYDFVEEEFEE